MTYVILPKVEERVERKLKLNKDTNADKHIPELSYDLIDYLAKLYPPKCIRANETLEEAHRYAGAVQLVSDLVEWKENESIR